MDRHGMTEEHQAHRFAEATWTGGAKLLDTTRLVLGEGNLIQ